MDPARALREARRSAGLSQRALALRSGVGLRSITAVESGARQPSVAVLDRLLEACGQHLAVVDGRATAPPACVHLREHLARSTTERWRTATRRTGHDEALHAALQSLGSGCVLEPSAAVPVWVPGAPLSLPVVVEGPPSARPRPAVRPDLLVFRTSAEPPPPGLVRVRTHAAHDVLLLPPDVLARQHCCRRWWPALSAAASLLHVDAGRDAAGRRPPPHRQPDEDEEGRRLAHALRYTDRPRPDARDSRALRIDSPVSLPQWLAARGLPPLLGQRAPW